MTLVALRHSYTSSVIDYNRPIRELKAIATSMGHSVSAQKMYQWTGGKNEVMEGDLQVGIADLAPCS